MSDHAPLTDEELAAMDGAINHLRYADVRRLIADLRASRAEAERWQRAAHSYASDAGPYMLLHWTDDIRHAEPCDCDLDEETAGEACMANSEWTYAVCVDGGAFAPRLILTLPRRPPEQPDHDGPPLVAVPQPQRRRT